MIDRITGEEALPQVPVYDGMPMADLLAYIEKLEAALARCKDPACLYWLNRYLSWALEQRAAQTSALLDSIPFAEISVGGDAR